MPRETSCYSRVMGNEKQPETLPGERRDVDRVDILGDLQGEIMVFEPMTIIQISEHGAQLETLFRLHLGSLHDIRLTLGEDSVIVKGRIVHTSVSDVEHEQVLYRSGIEFVEPPERTAKVIAAVVGALKSDRTGPDE